MKNPDYPCICGHEKAVHEPFSGICSHVDFPFDPELRKHCWCFVFTPDNLKYLESKINEQ